MYIDTVDSYASSSMKGLLVLLDSVNEIMRTFQVKLEGRYIYTSPSKSTENRTFDTSLWWMSSNWIPRVNACEHLGANNERNASLSISTRLPGRKGPRMVDAFIVRVTSTLLLFFVNEKKTSSYYTWRIQKKQYVMICAVCPPFEDNKSKQTEMNIHVFSIFLLLPSFRYVIVYIYTTATRRTKDIELAIPCLDRMNWSNS